MARWIAALALGVIIGSGQASARELYWEAIDVRARLDAEGALYVEERQTYVFDGTWNGGERSFNIRTGQKLDFEGMTRIDPQTGARIELERGDLDRVDNYDWTSRHTLRWRSRLPTDPAFDDTVIIYELRYTLSRILRRIDDRYQLDHDFAFPDRLGDIRRFTLDLELDPAWQPPAGWAGRIERTDLVPGRSVVVTADLQHLGDGKPVAQRGPAPLWFRGALMLLSAVAMGALFVLFWRRERHLGRGGRLDVDNIDRAWLEEHVFDLLPEEAGALWDRSVGPQEVAAVLARLVADGKLESRVEEAKGLFGKPILHLELKGRRGSFTGYEGKLVHNLFFGGRKAVDTNALRKHYKRTGFDPASKIRGQLERGLKRKRKDLHDKSPAPSRKRTRNLAFAAVGSFLVELLFRPLPVLWMAVLVVISLAFFYMPGLIAAVSFRKRIENLGAWSLSLLIPAAGVFFFAVSGSLLTGGPEGLHPGIFASLGFALVPLMAWSSILNMAHTREGPGAIARRREIALARTWFRRQLRREKPDLDDAWTPHLLALGLAGHVDRWFRGYGGNTVVDTTSYSTASSFGSGSSWTGGGGSFGGAGAAGAWTTAAVGLASGVSPPGSSSGGSSGGGGGGSSGGGGGGGW